MSDDQPSGVVRHRVQDSPSKGQSIRNSHRQFVLEHRSVQEEAGFHRQAWCQMPVIVSGHENRHYSQYNGRQSHNRSGFISCHKAKNGLSKMVLHAEQIELIDSGD
ncbi:primosomal replication protein N [Escherichia coli]|nr:primosomal replication protein N [Escherichia coli]